MGRERRKWTVEEQAQLIEAVNKAKRPILWREIAKSVPGRSNKDCRRHWCNTLNTTMRKGLWTESEDERLMDGVQEHGSKWTLVAEKVVTRNAEQCSSHWSQTLNPDIDCSDWTPEEDLQLLQAIREHGTNWTKIASAIQSRRTGLSLKNRHSALLSKANRILMNGYDRTMQASDRQSGRAKRDVSFAGFDYPGRSESRGMQNGQLASLETHSLQSNGGRHVPDPELFGSTAGSQVPMGPSHDNFPDQGMFYPEPFQDFSLSIAPQAQFQSQQQRDGLHQASSGPHSLEHGSMVPMSRGQSIDIDEQSATGSMNSISNGSTYGHHASQVRAQLSTGKRSRHSQALDMGSVEPRTGMNSYASSVVSESGFQTPRDDQSSERSLSQNEELQRMSIEVQCTTDQIGRIMHELVGLSKTVTVKVNP